MWCKLFFLLISVVCLTAAGAEKKNPAAGMFGENLALTINFDDGRGAPSVLAGELGKGTSASPVFTDKGLFGKALAGGKIIWPVTLETVDFGRDTTIVFWMALVDTGKKAQEPLYLPLTMTGTDATFLMGRQGNAWGRTSIYNYVYLPGKKRAMSRLFNTGSAAKWKHGEWHMIATVWTPNSLGISVDGSQFEQTALESPLPGKITRINIDGNKPGEMLLDELIIFDRKLDREELKAMYDRTMKVLSEK